MLAQAVALINFFKRPAKRQMARVERVYIPHLGRVYNMSDIEFWQDCGDGLYAYRTFDGFFITDETEAYPA